MPDIKVSINLFEGHFRDGNVVEDVQAIFGDSSISFRQLVFEITERQPLEQLQAGERGHRRAACARLSRLAMDDAGTGHSNLAYMQTLGVDVIKIDRVFVDMIKPGTTQVPVLDGLIVDGARPRHRDRRRGRRDRGAGAVSAGARRGAWRRATCSRRRSRSAPFRDLARALNGVGKVETGQPAIAAGLSRPKPSVSRASRLPLARVWWHLQSANSRGRARMSADVNEQRKALREAALHFHEFPKPGKLEIQADQAAGQPARPGAGLFARRRGALRGDRRRSGRGDPATPRAATSWR